MHERPDRTSFTYRRACRKPEMCRSRGPSGTIGDAASHPLPEAGALELERA
jgi:hypothetical protein